MTKLNFLIERLKGSSLIKKKNFICFQSFFQGFGGQVSLTAKLAQNDEIKVGWQRDYLLMCL